MRATIYIDGSCYYVSKLGGVGAYIILEDQEYFISQGFEKTTISRMEGMALFLALKSLDKDAPIHADIYSDSEYIIKSFTENRLTKWVMIGWDRVKNVDMWKAIIHEIETHPKLKLKFHHIRGHQDDCNDPHSIGNCIVDKLANFKIHKIYNKDVFI